MNLQEEQLLKALEANYGISKEQIQNLSETISNIINAFVDAFNTLVENVNEVLEKLNALINDELKESSNLKPCYLNLTQSKYEEYLFITKIYKRKEPP